MKLFPILLLFGITTAAKLTNTYLPPSHAGSSGGHSGFLQGPSQLNPTQQIGFGSQQQGAIGQGQYQGQHQQQQNSFLGSSSSSSFESQHQSTANIGSGLPGYGGQSSSFQQQRPIQSQRPQTPTIPIIKYENINNGDGSYQFEYQAADGSSRQEKGYVNNPGTENAEQVVSGSYSYTGSDGVVYTVHYKADSNGFQAFGDHLPTPPPIPAAIQQSLLQNQQQQGYGQQQQQQQGYGQQQQQQQGYGQQQQSFTGSSSSSGYNYGTSTGISSGRPSTGNKRPQNVYIPPQTGSSLSSGTASGYSYKQPSSGSFY